jgi:hypothetical protein
MNGMAREKLKLHKPNIVGAIGQVSVCVHPSACFCLSVVRCRCVSMRVCVFVCLSVSVSKGPPCVNLRLRVR